jgi:hypothetical protein
MVTGKQVMATKDKEKFNRLQQEQRDLDASYRQSLKNKKERTKTLSEMLREGFEYEKNYMKRKKND